MYIHACMHGYWLVTLVYTWKDLDLNPLELKAIYLYRQLSSRVFELTRKQNWCLWGCFLHTSHGLKIDKLNSSYQVQWLIIQFVKTLTENILECLHQDSVSFQLRCLLVFTFSFLIFITFFFFPTLCGVYIRWWLMGIHTGWLGFRKLRALLRCHTY